MGLIIEFPFLIILSSILWIPFRIIFNIVKKHKFNTSIIKKEVIYYLFVLYLALLIGVTLFPIRIGPTNEPVYCINFIPFNFDIYPSLNTGVIGIIGNLILLSPLAILLPIINRDKFNSVKKLVIIALFTSLSIEFLQLVINFIGISDIIRTTDINDVILNVLGIFIGHFTYKNLFSKLET